MVVQLEDRRVFDRFMARFPVKFRYSKRDFGSNVFLRDVSASGAKIATNERLTLTDKVSLLVEVPDGHEPVKLNGEIVWLTFTDANSWEAGLRFDKIDFMDTQRIFKFCEETAR